jgi:hypothetical protein
MRLQQIDRMRFVIAKGMILAFSRRFRSLAHALCLPKDGISGLNACPATSYAAFVPEQTAAGQSFSVAATEILRALSG